mmetsp:Transcript_28369/g.40060  ORF Transcript_28369/g.40060 Transcript_28369/m.40060 type:complete len:188 (-) Transcript_28369:45-608(-)
MATTQEEVAPSNARGIPKANFIENLDEFMAHQESADAALRNMQEVYSKFKFMESQLTKNKKELKTKIPDIKTTLEGVKYLAANKDKEEPIETHFELSDAIYGLAKVKPSTVCLWLGANVMVEYSFDEAIALLTKNLTSAETNLNNYEEDLAYLKDQITTTEVNIARVYNHDVKQRRKKREAQPQPQK